MSIEVHTLQRIALTEETSANFATDLTASATYEDVPFQEGTATLALQKPNLEPQTAQQRIDAYPLGVLGPKSAQLTFTMVLAPSGDAAGDGVSSPAAEDSALILLLELMFGGVDESNAGTTLSGVTDEDNFTYTSGTGFTNGGVMGWADASGVLHARELGGSSLPKINLPSAPSISDVAYAGTTVYLADDPTSSIQMIVEGAEQSDRWLLMGGQVTSPPTITVPIGQLPTIQFTITFADWAQEPGAAITAASYTSFDPTYVHGFLRAQVAGTETLQNLDVSAIQWTLNSPVFQPVTSPTGTNTIARWRRSRAVPAAEVSLTLPYEAETWFTERDDRDYYHIAQQIGTTAGGVILITLPTAQVWDVQRVDAGGLASQQVTFRGTNDSQASTGTEIRRSAFRMHFL